MHVSIYSFFKYYKHLFHFKIQDKNDLQINTHEVRQQGRLWTAGICIKILLRTPSCYEVLLRVSEFKQTQFLVLRIHIQSRHQINSEYFVMFIPKIDLNLSS